jgi:hypothetical protein
MPKHYGIKQCTINKTGGYIIRHPGCYVICEDICFSTCNSSTAAITIDSDNVVLNMNCYKLSQCINNNNNVSGIQINGNRNNISIIGNNAFIQNFNGWGIDYQGPNTKIVINGVTIQGCGSDNRIPNTTILVDGGVRIGQVDTTDNLVSEVLVTNVHIIDNKNIGLSIGADNDIIIRDSIIDHTYSIVPIYQVTGLAIRSQNVANPVPRVKNVSITNTTIRRTQCQNIKGFAGIPPYGVIGLHYVGIDNINIVDCNVTNTLCAADNDDPSGPFIVFANNVVQSGVINAIVENNNFSDTNGDHWCLFSQNFHTSANSAVPGTPTSGLISTLNHVYKNNNASGATGYCNVTGFGIYYASNVLVENCHSSNVKVLGPFVGPPFPPSAIGFTFETASGVSSGPPSIDNLRGAMNNIVVKNCSSINNVAEIGRANGFCYAAGYFNEFEIDGTTSTPEIHLKDISFINCVTQGNIAKADNVLGAQAVGAGFLIDRGVIANQGNFVGPVPITGYKSPESLGNIFINECHADNCYGADTGIQYSGGIVVLGVDKCQILNSNISDSQNGVLLGGGSSYLLNFNLGNTVNSLVKTNNADNNKIGFSDIAGTNAFVDNVSYNNIIAYNNVSNVLVNGNRSF